MSDYTPTTDQVRERYCAGWTGRVSDEYGEAFDRWLDQALREAKAEAWDEGYDEPRECCGMCPLDMCPWDNNKKGPPIRTGRSKTSE